MKCEECNSCPIKVLCDKVDTIIDETLSFDDMHDILMAIYEKGRQDAIDEFKQALKQELNKYDFWIYEIADSDGYTLETSCDRDYLIDEVAEQLKENK